MAPDDAADIVGELDEERREPVLALLPVSHRVKVRALLGYDPAEAGGLMSPDFVLLRGSTTAADALAAVRRSAIAARAADDRVRRATPRARSRAASRSPRCCAPSPSARLDEDRQARDPLPAPRTRRSRRSRG